MLHNCASKGLVRGQTTKLSQAARKVDLKNLLKTNMVSRND